MPAPEALAENVFYAGAAKATSACPDCAATQTWTPRPVSGTTGRSGTKSKRGGIVGRRCTGRPALCAGRVAARPGAAALRVRGKHRPDRAVQRRDHGRDGHQVRPARCNMGPPDDLTVVRSFTWDRGRCAFVDDATGEHTDFRRPASPNGLTSATHRGGRRVSWAVPARLQAAPGTMCTIPTSRGSRTWATGATTTRACA